MRQAGNICYPGSIRYGCGATLITERHVVRSFKQKLNLRLAITFKMVFPLKENTFQLTAAHCVEGHPPAKTVLLGVGPSFCGHLKPPRSTSCLMFEWICFPYFYLGAFRTIPHSSSIPVHSSALLTIKLANLGVRPCICPLCPPPLIFAKISIALKHKKSVSKLWIS